MRNIIKTNGNLKKKDMKKAQHLSNKREKGSTQQMTSQFCTQTFKVILPIIYEKDEF